MKRTWSHTLQIGNARREVEGKFRGDEYSRDYFDIKVIDPRGVIRSLSVYPESIRDEVLEKVDMEVRF
jgi:hypothetical protein